MQDAAAASSAISKREFREALGCFATGITVVTATTADGARIGATVSSFNSVSLEPPLVLFSMARSSRAFAAWQAVNRFAVNVLAEGQGATSTRFARALGDKWDGVGHVVGRNGAPLLANSLAWFECARHADHDGGDHIIIVGRVLAVEVRRHAESAPLIFFRSKYRQLADDGGTEAPPDVSRLFYGW